MTFFCQAQLNLSEKIWYILPDIFGYLTMEHFLRLFFFHTSLETETFCVFLDYGK